MVFSRLSACRDCLISSTILSIFVLDTKGLPPSTYDSKGLHTSSGLNRAKNSILELLMHHKQKLYQALKRERGTLDMPQSKKYSCIQ